MKRARITLFQLAVTANGYEPDGAPYATEAEAETAKAEIAREWLESRFEDAEELRSELGNYDIETARPTDEINSLADLTDDEVVNFAEERIGFNGHVYSTDVEIDVYVLSDALRAAGAAVTLFTVDDVAERFDGDRDAAADWLVGAERRLGDTLAERGNEALDDLLLADGVFKSADRIEAEEAGYTVEDDGKGGSHPFTGRNPEGDDIVYAATETEAWAGVIEHMNGGDD